jgi:hypothetical protein
MRNKKGVKSKDISLFDMRTTRPDDTAKVSFDYLGRTFPKKKFNKFIDEVMKSLNVRLDKQVYSYMMVEESLIDGESYFELSLSKDVYLPIAGSQYHIIERYARDNDMSLVGFVDSINFILNDSRVYL